MTEAVSYEEQRRRQVEANKRKLEELQLHHLSAAVREAAAKPAKKRKARVPRDAAAEPLRRSGRVANLPDKPVYVSGRRNLADEATSYAISKAEELEQELGSRFPIFVKPMVQSYVGHATGRLFLPRSFCVKHMPNRDETITLVDEEDDESETLYLAMTTRLSAGWRRFSIEHKLVVGDCLVFQLIERTKFKSVMEVGALDKLTLGYFAGYLKPFAWQKLADVYVYLV